MVLQALAALLLWSATLAFLFLGIGISSSQPASLLAADSSTPLGLRQRLILFLTSLVMCSAALTSVLLLFFPHARVARSIHAAALLLVLVALLASGAAFISEYASRGSLRTRAAVQSAWTSAVSRGDTESICDAESDFSCRGFQDYDCVGCARGDEPACSVSAGNAGDRCASCGASASATAPERGCWPELSVALGRLSLSAALVVVFAFVVVIANGFGVAFAWGNGDRRGRARRREQHRYEAQTEAKSQAKGKRLPRADVARETIGRNTCNGAALPRRPPPAAVEATPLKNLGGRVDPKSIRRIPKRPPKRLPLVL